MIQFEPKQQPAFIKVIGVGGGGSNAVNHMFKQGIKGVEFAVCNTDAQALAISPVPNKIRIGETDGLGAGSNPEVGEEAARTSIEALEEAFTEDIKMVFITAGMGGGTGTGAAPIIAQLAREKGILTVGIVTLPFTWEGRRRKQQAEAGIESIKKYVDSLLVINNDKLREQYNNLPVTEAFAKADNVLTTAAKGIAEIITVTGYVNTDFEDVKTVIQDSGKAIMGSATAEGENRAMVAIEEAMNSPLLDDNDIKGAQNILLHIVTGTDEITIDEITEITEFVQSVSGNEADLIWGQGYDDSLENKIGITLIATGFNSKKKKEKPKKIHTLDITKKETETQEQKTEIKAAGESKEPAKEFIRITKKDRPEIKETVQEDTQTSISFKKTTTPEKAETINESGGSRLTDKPTTGGGPGSGLSDEKPVTIEFDEPSQKPERRHLSVGRTVNDATISASPRIQPLPSEEDAIQKNAQERINKLKSLSKLHSADIAKLESEPAFRRKNIEIDNTPPSTLSPVSKFTLGEDSKNNPVIKSDNSYLHDNVD